MMAPIEMQKGNTQEMQFRTSDFRNIDIFLKGNVPAAFLREDGMLTLNGKPLVNLHIAEETFAHLRKLGWDFAYMSALEQLADDVVLPLYFGGYKKEADVASNLLYAFGEKFFPHPHDEDDLRVCCFPQRNEKKLSPMIPTR